ncbi:aminotransferase class I/II-fold pyridoxal phosphate-dependent enzyme [Micromonospora sp. DT228]|uniref:aminotransferase class I/II-fold pyridoxal phosphate-dependent enzyme n=1 Tax=Micromonospora sp. DT228 TaxID=3393443 RepID=UPI003CEC9CB1
MIDLTGPLRPWSPRVVTRFGAAQERARDSPSWWKTPAWRGEPALLERLAELFGAPPDRTVVTSGVRQFAASWAGMTASTLVETPTFADLPIILGSRGRVRSISWQSLTDGGVCGVEPVGVWVTSPFRNPDGRSLDDTLADALGQLAARGHPVLVNQVYRWFTSDAAEPTLPVGAWSVTSLAKLAGGGARLGWFTTPDTGELPRELTTGSPPTLWQRTWAEFLDPTTLRALWADCVEPTLDARRAFTERVAELVGWRVPGGGLSLLLGCDGVDEDAAVQLLEEHGLRVSRGAAFGSDKPSVRLAFSGANRADSALAADVLATFTEIFRPTQRQ